MWPTHTSIFLGFENLVGAPEYKKGSPPVQLELLPPLPVSILPSRTPKPLTHPHPIFVPPRGCHSLDFTGGFSSSGSGLLESTWTSRWLSRRTRELKMAARFLALAAALMFSRYWLRSHERGLMPLGSRRAGKDVSTKGHCGSRGALPGRRAGTWRGDTLHQGGDQSIPAGLAQGLSSLIVGKEAIGKVLFVAQSTVQPATPRRCCVSHDWERNPGEPLPAGTSGPEKALRTAQGVDRC